MSEREYLDMILASGDVGDVILIIISLMIFRIGGFLKVLVKDGIQERRNVWRVIYALIKHTGLNDLVALVPKKLRDEFSETGGKNDV